MSEEKYKLNFEFTVDHRPGLPDGTLKELGILLNQT